MYNCLVGAGGICRFIKINENKKILIDVNFIHSLKAPLVTRPLPDRYYFISCIWGHIWRAKMKKHKITCFYYRKYYDTKCQLINCSLTLLN